MKKLLFIAFLLFLTSSSVVSQKMNRQKITMLKTAFITDAIALKPKEAEKFWPVYNQYSKQLQQLKFKIEGGKMREIKAAGGTENLSEANAQEIINQSLIFEKEIYETKIKMVKELSKIISAQQIVKLQKAERDFNKRILQEYGKRKRMGQ
ncbi:MULTISPECIES: hypothetical protein [Flavobacteriaceae]|uniref:Sensor of ECF-type sigma factor n=2 Tax=Flavobacteriaceae TaxID=49546 RepID=A0A4Y8AV61_9FLAO|nr:MULTISPECIES: hypothetical protein [Flavobacteriaceae]TEW76436.1 hypothetical protein E2488_00880 [Gramella jeungdoensis]GGK52837.1 hypothetical protein GCM10007963_21510 [Lutibacter litoralis]